MLSAHRDDLDPRLDHRSKRLRIGRIDRLGDPDTIAILPAEEEELYGAIPRLDQSSQLTEMLSASLGYRIREVGAGTLQRSMSLAT